MQGEKDSSDTSTCGGDSRIPNKSTRSLGEGNTRHTDVQIGRKAEQNQKCTEKIEQGKIFSVVEKMVETTMVNQTECQEKIQKDPKNAELIEDKVRLMKESIKWNAAKEQFLRQKSKIQWMRQGDQNTKYFHSVIKGKRNTNRIFSIKDVEGKEITNVEGIVDAFINFYKKLLGKSKGDRQHVCSNLVRKGQVVQQEQREQLEAPVTDKEIKAALWSIAGDNPQDPMVMGLNSLRIVGQW
uniref:Uncharacterized protein LOC104228698 n=1 Tax=Nicotiana sylvestris TaxID=4096 RepID=A0A1U7WXY1_NICSY|nr:PREDICTED: uncharacterized protein LOC104228698 [Nicotiana sylvestris]